MIAIHNVKTSSWKSAEHTYPTKSLEFNTHYTCMMERRKELKNGRMQLHHNYDIESIEIEANIVMDVGSIIILK